MTNEETNGKNLELSKLSTISSHEMVPRLTEKDKWIFIEVKKQAMVLSKNCARNTYDKAQQEKRTEDTKLPYILPKGIGLSLGLPGQNQ